MVAMTFGLTLEDGKYKAKEALETGRAYQKFLEFVQAQGGDLNGLKISPNKVELKCGYNGKLVGIDAYKFRNLSCELGAGRLSKDDKVDPTVGIELKADIGQMVKYGDLLAVVYYGAKGCPQINVNQYFKIDTIRSVTTK